MVMLSMMAVLKSQLSEGQWNLVLCLTAVVSENSLTVYMCTARVNTSTPSAFYQPVTVTALIV